MNIKDIFNIEFTITPTQRFDVLPNLVGDILNNEELCARILNKVEAKAIFSVFLGRDGGGEREGKSLREVVNDLFHSEEYRRNRFIYQINRAKDNNEKVEVFHGRWRGYVEFSSLWANTSNAWNSCQVLYDGEALNLSFPQNSVLPIISARIYPMLRVFERLLHFYHEKIVGESVIFYYGDEPARDIGIAFCKKGGGFHYLVPDFEFFLSNGYQKLRNTPLPEWDNRSPLAYFRGTDTGVFAHRNISTAQRVKLCIMAKEYPEFVDAKITATQHDESYLNIYSSLGILADRAPPERIFDYKYNIDVDGNTNSWIGLQTKLLSGGVVLKVDSLENYEQWFYRKLQPWINFVPIKHDLSNLIEVIDYLNGNESHAREIAKNGRQLILDMPYELMVDYAATSFYIAMKRF